MANAEESFKRNTGRLIAINLIAAAVGAVLWIALMVAVAVVDNSHPQLSSILIQSMVVLIVVVLFWREATLAQTAYAAVAGRRISMGRAFAPWPNSTVALTQVLIVAGGLLGLVLIVAGPLFVFYSYYAPAIAAERACSPWRALRDSFRLVHANRRATWIAMRQMIAGPQGWFRHDFREFPWMSLQLIPAATYVSLVYGDRDPIAVNLA